MALATCLEGLMSAVSTAGIQKLAEHAVAKGLAALLPTVAVARQVLWSLAPTPSVLRADLHQTVGVP